MKSLLSADTVCCIFLEVADSFCFHSPTPGSPTSSQVADRKTFTVNPSRAGLAYRSLGVQGFYTSGPNLSLHQRPGISVPLIRASPRFISHALLEVFCFQSQLPFLPVRSPIQVSSSKLLAGGPETPLSSPEGKIQVFFFLFSLPDLALAPGLLERAGLLLLFTPWR